MIEAHTGDYEFSYENLNIWTKHLYQKLGWIALEHQYGKNPDLVKGYVKSINNLLDILRKKLLEFSFPLDKDKENERNIMLMYRKVRKLAEFNNVLLKLPINKLKKN